MPRNLDSDFAAALSDANVCPLILVQLTFRSGVSYVHSGVGDFVWNGKTFTGTGSLGKVGAIIEGVNIRAEGTSLELSGIDTALQSDCLGDIRLGAPAKIWIAFLDAEMALVGVPYLWFSGTVDKPTFLTGAERMTIQLALENKMINLQRPNVLRYTSADQRLRYPTDTAFGWVEQLNDLALIWGS